MLKDEETSNPAARSIVDENKFRNVVRIIAQSEERERGRGRRKIDSDAARRRDAPRAPVIFRERHTTGALLRQTHGTCCCRVYGVFTSDVTATPEYGG